MALDLVIKNATRYEVDGKLILNNFDVERFEMCRDDFKGKLEKKAKDDPKAKPPEKPADKK